jgi:hypothetical protein
MYADQMLGAELDSWRLNDYYKSYSAYDVDDLVTHITSTESGANFKSHLNEDIRLRPAKLFKLLQENSLWHVVEHAVDTERASVRPRPFRECSTKFSVEFAKYIKAGNTGATKSAAYALGVEYLSKEHLLEFGTLNEHYLLGCNTGVCTAEGGMSSENENSGAMYYCKAHEDKRHAEEYSADGIDSIDDVDRIRILCEKHGARAMFSLFGKTHAAARYLLENAPFNESKNAENAFALLNQGRSDLLALIKGTISHDALLAYAEKSTLPLAYVTLCFFPREYLEKSTMLRGALFEKIGRGVHDPADALSVWARSILKANYTEAFDEEIECFNCSSNLMHVIEVNLPNCVGLVCEECSTVNVVGIRRTATFTWGWVHVASYNASRGCKEDACDVCMGCWNSTQDHMNEQRYAPMHNSVGRVVSSLGDVSQNTQNLHALSKSHETHVFNHKNGRFSVFLYFHNELVAISIRFRGHKGSVNYEQKPVAI